LPTRALTDRHVTSSAGEGASRAFRSSASAGSSSGQTGQPSGFGITGCAVPRITRSGWWYLRAT